MNSSAKCFGLPKAEHCKVVVLLRISINGGEISRERNCVKHLNTENVAKRG